MMQCKEEGEKAINMVMVVVVVVMAGLVMVRFVMVDMEVAIMMMAIMMMVVKSCYLPFRLPRANSLALPLPAS